MKVSVIIPAYNEQDTIGELIEEIKKMKNPASGGQGDLLINSDFEIIVVDDGSTDNTAETALSQGAKVCRHPYNIGNGASIKTGARAAQGEYLVFMDADGQHSPSDILSLLDDLDKYDMVVGARGKNLKLNYTRTILNNILNKIATFLAGHKILDLTSGFRAVKKERMMEFMHLLPNTFSSPSTLTLAMFKAGFPVGYKQLSGAAKRTKGKSKIKLFKDGFLFLCIVAKIIILFDPLKVFLPASVFLFLCGITLAVYQLIVHGGIFGGSVFILLLGVFIFFFGFLADQIASIRRDFRKY